MRWILALTLALAACTPAEQAVVSVDCGPARGAVEALESWEPPPLSLQGQDPPPNERPRLARAASTALEEFPECFDEGTRIRVGAMIGD